MRNAERLISLFPTEKRPGLLLTAGILYINYFQIMKRLTFGLYGRRKPKTEEAEARAEKAAPTSQKPGVRGFAPYPPSQYDEKLSYEEWMTETIAFFRSMGFFAGFRGLEDKHVLEQLHQKREEEIRGTWERIGDADAEDMWILETRTDTGGSSTTMHSDPGGFPGSVKYGEYLQRQRKEALEGIPVNRKFDRTNDLADLWIALEDETRAWYSDLEQTAGPDSDDYVQVMKSWQKISRGAFEPANVTETWTPIDEYVYRLQIRFDWEGSAHLIEITTPDEWINLEVLDKINELIRDSGMQYHVYKAFDQCAYVVVLTADEKAALEQKRQWKFSR